MKRIEGRTAGERHPGSSLPAGSVDAAHQLPPAAGEQDRPRDGTARSLYVLFGPPAAASLAFLGNLAIARAGCDTVPAMVRIGLGALAIAISVHAGILALRRWRASGESGGFPPGAVAARERFLGMTALAAAAASLLIALYITAVVLFLEPCWY